VKRTLLILSLVLVLILSACGGKEAQTCDDLAQQTIELTQKLIDDVEAEVGDMTVQELMATGGELPSVDKFKEEASKIDERAVELGCSQTEIGDGVASRIGQLESHTPIGRFMIEAIRSGGL
jgi:hypothetical protein